MITVCFLQNQWFKDPERMKQLLARFVAKDPHMGRERFIETFLFWSCLTGRRLLKAFTEQSCREYMIWEEASDYIGGEAKSAHPADPAHMMRVLKKHKPKVVMTFGKIALNGLDQITEIMGSECKGAIHLHGPHPAARHGTVVKELEEMNAAYVDACHHFGARTDHYYKQETV